MGGDVESPREESSTSRWTVSRIVLLTLALLLIVGVVIRVLAAVAWWPISPTLADSWPYAAYAEAHHFSDPQHPAGYSLFLALGGLFTRDVGAFGMLQSLLGIVSALVMFSGVRRLCGSPWPGVAAAAAILLSADQVYLERTIMSETLFTFLLAMTVYATARALEQPQRWWPWPLVTAAMVFLAGMTRPAGFVLIPLIALALVLARPRPWLARWRPVASFVGLSCVLLISFAGMNKISNGHFEIAPTPGWHLYSRVAPFADCSQFDPPQGTQRLCEHTPYQNRFGPDWYLYDPHSPATRLFGGIGVTGGTGDSKLGAFARQVILHEPKAYLEAVWPDLKGYFFSDDYVWKLGEGTDLDGQLNWSAPAYPKSERITERGMEDFFDPFSARRNRSVLDFLHDYQRIFRIGGTALTIAALLTLLGLFVGSRRRRIAVLLLGVGGFAMFLLPTFSVVYSGRYAVPSGGVLAAAAVIAVMSAWDRVRRMREERQARPA